jgi:hypothetical protein
LISELQTHETELKSDKEKLHAENKTLSDENEKYSHMIENLNVRVELLEEERKHAVKECHELRKQIEKVCPWLAYAVFLKGSGARCRQLWLQGRLSSFPFVFFLLFLFWAGRGVEETAIRVIKARE